MGQAFCESFTIASHKVNIIYTMYTNNFLVIPMFYILAKCWKSSEMAKNGIFLPNSSKFRPNKCLFNKYYPEINDQSRLIIPLPKNDKTVF